MWRLDPYTSIMVMTALLKSDDDVNNDLTIEIH